MRCLICHEEIAPVVTWVNFWQVMEKQTCCQTCKDQFVIIEPGCPKCHRSDSKRMCFDCERWGNGYPDPLEQNVSLFEYNDFAKDWVAKWKYRGDYVLVDSIRKQMKSLFEKTGWEAYPLVPIPLSEERLFERGFNQSEALIHLLEKQPYNLLKRVHAEKQSKKQRWERVASINPFRLEVPVREPVVLVDDIYTTGTTVRHVAALLKEAGCPRVFSLTIFR